MWRTEVAVLSVISAALLVVCSAAPAARSSQTTRPTASPSAPAASATESSGIKYVAIGASDTVGVGASDPAKGSWPAIVASHLPAGSPPYVNLGVSGSLAVQAVTQQLPGAIAQRPSLVSVWLAVNDLNATIEPASFAESLGQIVDGLAQKPARTIFVGKSQTSERPGLLESSDQGAAPRGNPVLQRSHHTIAAKYPGRVNVFDSSPDRGSRLTEPCPADGFHLRTRATR